MKTIRTLPKEGRYAQHLIYLYPILVVISLVLSLFIRYSLQQDLINTGESIGACLFWLFLGWQFGRLRRWARLILIWVAGLSIASALISLVSFLFLPIPHQYTQFYGYLYLVQIGISTVIDIALLYYLRHPAVQGAFLLQYSNDADPVIAQHKQE